MPTIARRTRPPRSPPRRHLLRGWHGRLYLRDLEGASSGFQDRLGSWGQRAGPPRGRRRHLLRRGAQHFGYLTKLPLTLSAVRSAGLRLPLSRHPRGHLHLGLPERRAARGRHGDPSARGFGRQLSQHPPRCHPSVASVLRVPICLQHGAAEHGVPARLRACPPAVRSLRLATAPLRSACTHAHRVSRACLMTTCMHHAPVP